METAAKKSPASTGLPRITIRLKKIAGILLPAVAVFMIVLVFYRPSRDTLNVLQLGFYPTEQNRLLDYNFAHPHAQLFLPERPTAPAELTFRVFSPDPLPQRPLTLRYDHYAIDLPAIDASPRIVHVVLPPAQPEDVRGLLIELETAKARVSGDPRDLGLLFDYVTARELPIDRAPWQSIALVALLIGCYVFTVRFGRGFLFAGLVLLLLSALLLIDGRLCLLVAGLLVAGMLWAQAQLRTPLSRLAERAANAALNPARRYALMVVVVGCIYTVVLSFYSIAHYAMFYADTYDLGQYDQTLWLISRGFYAYSTGMGLHILGNHGAFILYPLAALYWIASDVRFLLIVQTIIIALGVVPIYLIAKAHDRPLVGLIVAIAYLLHPATINMNLFDFHPDTLAATALLFAIWAAERRRWWIVGIACLIILGAKENFALTVAFFGFWLICRRLWRPGVVLLLVGTAWFFFATRVMLPAFNGQQEALHLSRFSQFGNSMQQIAAFFLLHPQVILADLLQPAKLYYLAALLLPFAFLPLLSPRYLILALPALMLNMLSNYDAQQTLIFHYNALIIAVAAVACINAILWLVRRVSHAYVVIGGVVAMLLIGSLYTIETTYMALFEYKAQVERSDLRYLLYRDVAAAIPMDANISAQSKIQPHLTHRTQAFMFPNPFQWAVFYNPDDIPFVPRVDYIIYDTRRADNFYVSARSKLELLAALQSRGLFRKVIDLDGVVLLQRSDAPLDERCFGTAWNAPQCDIRR